MKRKRGESDADFAARQEQFFNAVDARMDEYLKTTTLSERLVDRCVAESQRHTPGGRAFTFRDESGVNDYEF